MIPRRVYLKNFLCHAEQEFRFEEHPVWLLHGANGVGKSAVFDAMVYALYGESRRSDNRKNAVVDVIRHGEKSMRVEFEFELGGMRYQVWRTRARSGQPKQGVNSWCEGCWSPVRNVNLGDELNAWVVNNLGLTYETFVSAVLLRQGAAEKLIDADRGDRQSLFRSFIDLDPYIRLHEAVTSARTVLFEEARGLRNRLNGLSAVTEDQITVATAAAKSSSEGLERARTAENAARNLLGHARTWAQNETTRSRIEAELDAAKERASRAAELETQVGRLRSLRLIVDGLFRVAKHQETLQLAEEAHGQRREEEARAKSRNDELGKSLSRARAELDKQHEQATELTRRITDAETEQKRLSTEIERAEKAAALHKALAELRSKEFDADLDEKSSDAERDVTAAQAAKDALPHLGVLFDRRSDYRLAVTEETAATTEAAEASAEVERLLVTESELLAECGNADLRKSKAEQFAAVANDQLENAIKQQSRFAAAATKPVCSECGQEIDAAHAARERGKLEGLVQAARGNLERCSEEVKTTTTAAERFRERHSATQSDRQSAERRRDEASGTRKNATRRRSDAKTGFDRALAQLQEPFATRVPPIDEDGFPSKDDLSELRASEKELTDLIRHRDCIVRQVTDRGQTRSSIQMLEASLAVIDAPSDVSAARDELARIDNGLVMLRSESTELETRRMESKKAEQDLQREQQELTNGLPALAGEVARAESAVNSATQLLDEALASIPDSERATALTTTSERRQALLDEQNELERAEVEKQFETLAEERALQTERERQLTEVCRLSSELPEDARRSLEEVEQEVSAAESAARTAGELDETNRNELRTLLDQKEQRRTTEEELNRAERNHALHDELARHLGLDGIQLNLARGAERRIILRANEILVRLSSGELRFEPPDPRSTRAFDLSVRRLGCPEPIAVGNLSGGQRFRVAVSLALAVCQGAGDAARRLESVIIDEGFGSLDQDGRAAMVEELRDGPALREMFRCIIVVSHQEDFASAFPIGYRLRSENGTTHVEAFRPV